MLIAKPVFSHSILPAVNAIIHGLKSLLFNKILVVHVFHQIMTIAFPAILPTLIEMIIH